MSFGLSTGQVDLLRETYGPNSFPEIPMKGFFMLFFEAFQDTILLVLIAAATVSLIIGFIEDPSEVRRGRDLFCFGLFGVWYVLSGVFGFRVVCG